MADTGRPDGTDDGPSLEMPSFSLRRRKKASEEAAPDLVAAPAVSDAPVTAREPAPTTAYEPAAVETPPRARPRRELPALALSGVAAAAVTGVLVGALAVVLAWLSTTACDVVRGTSACGGGPGLLILVAMLVVLAYAGSLLLGVFGVQDPGSTSILAVGILAVLVLVFLLGSIDAWWMVIAIPVAAVIGFCASWWVTHAVVGEDADQV
ncbi:hypothetical protein SAMN05192575_1209 [Nocardioides alpinus]|uniref:Uncharacterized protein n=1 Tax=Nocardioides alpinus TaxID=748909 RepID=A0A1I1BHJ6_9ACTN|nr:hypothetical protein [Nocardioides alpinus]PKH38415.1 hypothetical protein CXG46_15275 [Nocardioides alpinus]SFB49202.1 hypothetical protein SAMN05192575_1209 [Nocardioides alpinus]